MPPRPSKRRRTGPGAAAAAASARAAADPRPSAPPPGQHPGELQAACTVELASSDDVRSLAPDRAAAIRRLALATFLQDRLAPTELARGRLTDPVGLAGGLVDGGPAGRAIVTRRRVLALPAVERGWEINALPPGLRDAVEALLYAPGWAGPAWMETSDRAGGFRQLVHFPQFRLAVSKSDTLRPLDSMGRYVPPAGWRVARAAELVAAGFGDGVDNGTRVPASEVLDRSRGLLDRCTYYENLAGWDKYVWGGVFRCFFLTADWETVNSAEGGAVHVGFKEGQLDGFTTAASLRSYLFTSYFGGMVCVRDSPAVSVA